MTPALRIRPLNDAPVRADGRWLLYWMIANRRTHANFSLEHALDRAAELGKPLVVLEALRVDHRWAAARFHRFVLDGMRDNAARFDRTSVCYHAYMERRPGDGAGLLDTLAKDAAEVITDDFPSFFLPRMAARVAARLPVRMVTVDSNGLLPLRATDAVAATAFAFRRILQQLLPEHLAHRPQPDPLKGRDLPGVRLPETVSTRWPSVFTWADDAGAWARLPIDHAIGPTPLVGGSVEARKQMFAFIHHRLADYAEHRNHPDKHGASGLSPYLHWGHLSAHEIFEAIVSHEGWLGDLPRKVTGAREGWWGMSAPAEAYLDELVTWREVGYNMAAHRDDYDQYDSLPNWARLTLDKHRKDPRTPTYDLGTMDRAETYDRVWNAAQRQLQRDGRIHNYLRMLWGKKVLEWSPSPQEALAVLIELNNKYALDGRNPNSYSGIFWTLGRYDRPWGPERPVFGTIRYMSSQNTARKVRLQEYLATYGGPEPPDEHEEKGDA